VVEHKLHELILEKEGGGGKPGKMTKEIKEWKQNEANVRHFVMPILVSIHLCGKINSVVIFFLQTRKLCTVNQRVFKSVCTRRFLDTNWCMLWWHRTTLVLVTVAKEGWNVATG
jgi:hypothetical protein